MRPAVKNNKYNKVRKAISTDYRSRLKFIKLLVVIWVLAICYRLASLQLISPDQWISWANKQHLSQIKLAGQRGRILDRRDQVLAVSVPTASVFVRPGDVEDKSAMANLLSKHLKIDLALVEKKLNSSSPFVWVKRQIPRYQAEQVIATDLDGVGAVTEAKRYYPFSEAASTLIGKVGTDGNGLSGLEAVYEKILNPKEQTYFYYRDALGKKIAQADSSSGALNLGVGKDLKLSIDIELQQIANQQLSAAIMEHKAERALAILIDADNGNILAMSQAPAINFNSGKIKSRQDLINFASQAVYEPGSTFKPVVAALALDDGVVEIDQVFDTENGSFQIGRRTVKDVHGSDRLSVEDIVVQSSNIGMSKIAFEMGKEPLYNGLRKFGFGSKTNLVLPGESGGILRNYKNWADIDFATHSFGQGVAVTALQLVRAFAALVNGGKLYDLQLMGEESPPGKQIISKEVSQMMKHTLVQVVESEHGTGKRTQIDGVVVGGKTGTAQKAKTDGRGYEQGAYLASFIGFADGNTLGIDQRLVLLVMVDEPRGKSHYGGTVAGPAFKNIITESLYLIGMRENLS